MGIEFDGVDIGYVDDEIATKGVWFEYVIDGQEIAFRCKHAGRSNSDYRKLAEVKFKAVMRRTQEGTLPDSVADRLFAEIYAATVITDWRGITAKGKEVPFSRDNVVAYLTARAGTFRALREDCEDPKNFRAHSVEEEAGNSETS